MGNYDDVVIKKRADLIINRGENRYKKLNDVMRTKNKFLKDEYLDVSIESLVMLIWAVITEKLDLDLWSIELWEVK